MLLLNLSLDKSEKMKAQFLITRFEDVHKLLIVESVLVHTFHHCKDVLKHCSTSISVYLDVRCTDSLQCKLIT